MVHLGGEGKKRTIQNQGGGKKMTSQNLAYSAVSIAETDLMCV